MAYQLTDKELKGIVETIRGNVKKTESTPKQPSQNYVAFQEFKKNGPEKTETIQTRGKTNAQKLDVQKKKEDRLEAKSTVNAAQIKRDRTKKEYDDYVNSQEYRQKRTADIIAQQIAKDRDESQSFASTSDMTPPIPQQDEKEMRLRAARDQAEKEYNEAEDKKRFEADMEVITGLPEEQRLALERYSASKYGGRDIFGDETIDEMMEEYGRPRLDELERTFSRDKNAKRAEEVDAKAREFVSKRGGRGTLANILSVPVQTYSGIIGTGGQLAEMMIGTGGYKTQDPNAYGTIGQTLTGAIRGQTSENITEDLGDGFAGKAANIGYQGVMAAADSVAQAFLGGGGLGGATLAATNSFSQTMADASRKGATPAQAAMLATTTAGIEALTEKIPLDNLIRTAKGTNAKSVIANALRQAGIEATTEEISLLGTVLADAAILQEKSTYQRDIMTAIMSGIPVDDAIQQASQNIIDEAVNTALVSMISGGASSLGGSYADARGMFAETQEQTNPELNRPKNAQEAIQEAIENNQSRRERLAADEAAQQPQVAQAQEPERTTTQPQQQEAPTQQPAQPKQSVSDTVAEVLTNLRETNGKATNKMAETVMSDPAAMQELGITPEGTKAEQRRRVKEEMEKLFQKQNSQNEPVQNVPETKPMQATETSEQATKQASAPTADMQMGANDQSEEGGQIRGTGAAEGNFSGKPAYNATLSEDNAQADRRDDVRPMELPERDVNGNNISAVTGNVYGAGVTPDEFASLMEEPTARGDFSYVPITNNQATQQAMDNIARLGWQDSYAQWSLAVRQGRAGAEMSARGALFLNHAAQAGDRHQWLNILSDFQRLGTNTAQGLQAFRILRNLAPSDRLYLMRRSVAQMVDDMHLNVPIQIDQQLADQYQNARTNEEADAILDQIITDVARQIPSTVGDRWTALRYVNMLGNMRTQARNISGNIGARATYMAKDQIGAALEKIVHRFNPNIQRTKSAWVNRDLKALGRADFDDVRDIVLENGRFDDARRFDSTRFAREVNERRQIFRSRFMESYRRLTNWAMNNDHFGDAGFARAAYARAFGGYLKANGFTGNTLDGIDQNLLDNARLYAIQQAQESTFRDHNAVSDWVGRIGRRPDTPRAVRTLSEGVMPFRSTPANVLVRAEEFSPLGIINTAVTAARAANPNSDITGTDVVESMAKTLTGTGLFIMGAYLGKMGMLAGGPDSDEEQAEFDKMNGYQNYALQLPDGKNITIDFLSPLAVPMFLGAELEKIISDGGYDLADFEKVFTSLADPLIQMSMLQGLNDTLDDIKYSENNLGQFFLNAAMSYLTQGLTNTLMGQLERSSEENRMTTYIDKDSAVPQWIQQKVGKMSQKIPGFDYQQVEYLDAWGETQKNEGGLAYDLLSPGYISTKKSDAVTTELDRLRESTGENVFPNTASKTITYTDKQGAVHKDHNLTAEQYQTYAQTKGQTARELWEEVVNTTDFDALTDAQKVKVSEDIKKYSREVGEIAAIGKDNHTGYSDGWMQDVEKGGAMEIIQRTIETGFSSAKENLSNAWENGYDEAAFIQEMETAFNSYKNASAKMQRQVYEESSSATKNYIDARQKGISNEKYLSVAKSLSKTGDTIIEKSTAIVKHAGLTDTQKTMLVKQNVSDAQDENIDLLMKMGYGIDNYVDLYSDYKNYTSGKGKKNRTINKWMKDYGISYAAAKKLYEVFP